MRIRFTLLLVPVLVCALFISTHAQTHVPRCATSPVSEEFLHLVRNAALTNKPASARLGADPTRIAIKAIFLLGSTRTPPPQVMLDSVLLSLDKYLKPLNVNFYWLGQPTYVRNDTYANTVDTDAFDATRAVYDADNAINLYFGFVSAAGLGRSFAYGPSPYKRTNCIYINTLFSGGYYENYYVFRNTLPHEFGHYFGLDHTFANSNSTVISDRELVTRGENANCNSKGDYICDTPADPYDQLITGQVGPWYIDNTSCRMVSQLTDVNGETYNPDIKNQMSYYSPFSCGTDMHFTPGQYERMRLGIVARLNYTCFGNDSYSITGLEPGLPRVSIDRIVGVNNGEVTTTNVQSICLGATARIAFSTSGSFQPNETFQVESTINPHLVGSLTPSLVKMPSEPVIGSPNQLAVRFTDSSQIGQLVYIRVRPSLTPAVGCLGATSFIVYQPGTVRVAFGTTSADTITVGFGELVLVIVRAEQQPNGQAYGSGRLLVNDTQIPYRTLGYENGQFIYVTAYKNSRIRLLDGLVGCGFVNLAGNLTVKVRPPSLALQQPAGLDICAGTALTLPFAPIVNSLTNGYRAQLSDANGQFMDDSTNIIGSAKGSPMLLQFPSSLSGGSGYRIRLQVNTSQGWIAALPGELVKINALPMATLQTAPTTITAGDSTRLTIHLSGQSPWVVKLSDGQSLTLTNPQSTVLVKPLKTTTYQLTAVQNACGMGNVSGSTIITVQQPLATDSLPDEQMLRLWPNPTDNDLTVEFRAPANQLVRLHITDASGRLVQTILKKGTGALLRHELSVRHLATGTYQLSLEGMGGIQMRRFLKK